MTFSQHINVLVTFNVQKLNFNKLYLEKWSKILITRGLGAKISCCISADSKIKKDRDLRWNSCGENSLKDEYHMVHAFSNSR